MAFKTKVDSSQGEMFKFDNKGKQLEGHYLGTFEHDGEYGPTKKHIIQNESGNQVVFGQKHLGELLEGIAPGTLVRITYKTDKPMKKGRHPMKLFELEYDEDQVIDVGSAISAMEQEASDAEDTYVEEEAVEEEVEIPAPAPRKAAPAAASRPAPSRTATAVSAEQQARVNKLLGSKR